MGSCLYCRSVCDTRIPSICHARQSAASRLCEYACRWTVSEAEEYQKHARQSALNRSSQQWQCDLSWLPNNGFSIRAQLQALCVVWVVGVERYRTASVPNLSRPMWVGCPAAALYMHVLHVRVHRNGVKTCKPPARLPRCPISNTTSCASDCAEWQSIDLCFLCTGGE